jgi:hypothetical protein
MSRLRSPGGGETLIGMVPTVDVAARLWEHLEGLSRGLDPLRPSIPTVRVTLDSGAMLEVFRAEPVEASIAAWRVRGFASGAASMKHRPAPAHGSATSVRLAVILGTRDGRAMVTERVSGASEEALVGGLVVSAEPGERALVELSEAIAAAVRALMEPSA